MRPISLTLRVYLMTKKSEPGILPSKHWDWWNNWSTGQLFGKSGNPYNFLLNTVMARSSAGTAHFPFLVRVLTEGEPPMPFPPSSSAGFLSRNGDDVFQFHSMFLLVHKVTWPAKQTSTQTERVSVQVWHRETPFFHLPFSDHHSRVLKTLQEHCC